MRQNTALQGNKRISSMPAEEYAIIVDAAKTGNPSLVTGYFTSSPGRQGFIFDYNFNPPWQRDFCLSTHSNKFVIGGFGAGKTRAVVMSFLYWAFVINDFKAIYAAPSNAQAKTAFGMITSNLIGSPMEQYTFPRQQPFAQIEIKFFRPDGVLHTASIGFVNAVDGADWVLSMEADWVHLDEAFKLTPQQMENAVRNLGSRARGVRATGEPRFGYFSITTNPFDNSYGWYLWNLANNNERWWTKTVPTFANGNVTDEQIEDMISRVDPSKVKQFLLGLWQGSEGNFYPADIVEPAFADEFPDGATVKESESYGPWYYTSDREDGYLYVAGVDLGTGKAPHRDAPAIVVVGIGNGHAKLVHFWWADGKGKDAIKNELSYIIKKYAPVKTYIDATGPQMGQFIMLQDALSSEGIVASLVPVRFNRSKGPIVYALRSVLEAGLLTIPPIDGLKQQLLSYPGPENDKRVPQDTVMALAMTALDVWNILRVNEVEDTQEEERVAGQVSGRSVSETAGRPIGPPPEVDEEEKKRVSILFIDVFRPPY